MGHWRVSLAKSCLGVYVVISSSRIRLLTAKPSPVIEDSLTSAHGFMETGDAPQSQDLEGYVWVLQQEHSQRCRTRDVWIWQGCIRNEVCCSLRTVRQTCPRVRHLHLCTGKPDACSSQLGQHCSCKPITEPPRFLPYYRQMGRLASVRFTTSVRTTIGYCWRAWRLKQHPTLENTGEFHCRRAAQAKAGTLDLFKICRVAVASRSSHF